MGPVSSVTGLGLVTIAVVWACPAEAQQRASGFWASAGAGVGLGVSDGLRDQEGDGGPALYVRLGGVVSQHARLAGEMLSWSPAHDLASTRQNFSFVLLFFPREDGLFVKGGAGAASANTRGGRRWGLGTTVGAGLEAVWGKTVVTANMDWVFQAHRDSGKGVSVGMIVATLGITWL